MMKISHLLLLKSSLKSNRNNLKNRKNLQELIQSPKLLLQVVLEEGEEEAEEQHLLRGSQVHLVPTSCLVKSLKKQKNQMLSRMNRVVNKYLL